MAILTRERTTSQYTITIRDERGTAIPKADVSSLKLTLLNLDDDARTIINDRNAQEQTPGFNGDVTLHDTSGLVTFTMTASDSPMLDDKKKYERHGVVIDVTLVPAKGSKRYVFEEEVLVENQEKIT